MKDFQIKTWKWVVLLLAVLNIALLASIWLKKDKPQGPPNGAKAADFLVEQLRFSTQQLESFNQLKEAHKHSIDSIRESGKEIHKLFFDNLKNETPDTGKVNALARSISDNQMQIELATFYHFQQVRILCNEQQKVKFDEIIHEVLRKMATPPNKKSPPPAND